MMLTDPKGRQHTFHASEGIAFSLMMELNPGTCHHHHHRYQITLFFFIIFIKPVHSIQSNLF